MLFWTAHRSIISASLMTSLGTVPLFLVSAYSVVISQQVGFGEARFGFAVSCYGATAALTAMLAGPGFDRLGKARAMILSGALIWAGAAGISLNQSSYTALLLFMCAVGMANAGLQVTANLFLTVSVPSSQQGLAFGVKQSSIPFAILVAGGSVALLGEQLWRIPFYTVSLCGLFVAIFGFRHWRARSEAPPRRPLPKTIQKAPVLPLTLAALSMSLGSAAVNSMGAFLPAWAFAVGLSPSSTGVLMISGSLLSILNRVLSGRAADRRRGRNFPVVARQLGIGALALIVVSMGTHLTVVGGALVAFGIGWAWPGLLMFAVVRVTRDAPNAASSAVQAGAFVGGAVGPACFGLIVASQGYPAAWRGASILLLLAAGLLLAARRQFVADLRRRPL
jgi:predicted MFS family arabinose efflux permease